MTVRKISTKPIAGALSTFVGVDGELFFDTVLNKLKISDGITAGGVAIDTGKPIIGLVRAQRTSGGSSTTTGKWTFTTITGSMSSEWVADASVAYPSILSGVTSPAIIHTFTGFTRIPSSVTRLGVTGSSPGFTIGVPTSATFSMTVTSPSTPNILTSFDPTVHKYYTSEGTTSAEDWYFLFQE